MTGIDRQARVESDGELQATFIVRLRRERGTPAGEWRGEVEHVQSALVAHFAEQAALLSFVRSQLAEIEPPAGAAATREVAGAADPRLSRNEGGTP